MHIGQLLIFMEPGDKFMGGPTPIHLIVQGAHFVTWAQGWYSPCSQPITAQTITDIKHIISKPENWYSSSVYFYSISTRHIVIKQLSYLKTFSGHFIGNVKKTPLRWLGQKKEELQRNENPARGSRLPLVSAYQKDLFCHDSQMTEAVKTVQCKESCTMFLGGKKHYYLDCNV